MNLIDLLPANSMKRVSSHQGGEYHGPCPVCGGKDRFHIWPGQREHGSFWCRGCGIGGDAITYLRIVEGMSFKEACNCLGVDSNNLPKITLSGAIDVFTPREPVMAVNELWQSKAAKLVDYAHTALLLDDNKMEWLAERGINQGAVIKNRLGWLSQDHYRDRSSWGLPVEFKDNGKQRKLWLPSGIVIPAYGEAEGLQRLRIRRPQGDPRYYVVPGSGTCTWYSKCNESQIKAAVVVESELDAIACTAAVDGMCIIALGNSSARPDHAAHKLLDDVSVVLSAMDYDAAGKHGSDNLCKWYGVKVKRWPPPCGKDPGDAYRQGVDIGIWLNAALK
jgi:DNA primase